MTIKHKYSVYGISCVGGSLFTGTCVADDIIKAIELFKEKECSVWNIERKEQVSAGATIEITSLNILDEYSAEGKSRENTYGLYKRIMKHDIKAVDDIHTLEDAKEIIKMISGNVYLNGEMYQLQQEYMEHNCKVMDFETCQHRKETDVMGVKQRSLFCDFDDMECDESNGKCRNQDKI